MGNNGTIGNGVATKHLIADSFSVAIDPQVTISQLWNMALLTANRSGADVVGSIKHDTYPQGFSGVILLLDGHIALQYGIASANMGFDHVGELSVLISTNGGNPLQERLRADYLENFTDLTP